MRVAITGGIAEGKSTILSWIGELGYTTASSDEVARTVFRDAEINHRLAKIAGYDATIEPAQLRAAIQSSTDVRRAVNRLMHPLIRVRLREIGAQFVEVPLLVEACLHAQYDQVWVVSCGQAEQARRLRERYGDDVDVERAVRLHLPTRVKVAFADEIIRTNAPLETVRQSLSAAVFRIAER